MIRYGLRLPELDNEYLDLAKENNYYDVLVLFLLQELERILQKGLHQGYINYDDNIAQVKGKIDFKQHIAINHNRKDKVFCSYSEFSPDISENRIIKYTLFYLSHCYFINDRINSSLLSYYKRLYEVNLVPVTYESFRSIEHSPLNNHYHNILNLCELLLLEISIDKEQIGDKTSISFLIDMNKLFEVFVGNLLIDRLDKNQYQVDLQRTEYPELTGKTLKVRIDIMISHKNKPILILDTKYQQFQEQPSEDHIAQINLYSTNTEVKSCGLIFVGRRARRAFYLRNMTLLTMSFDFVANNQLEFKDKCDQFIAEMESLLNSLKVSNLNQLS
jgi:5-methylcytosine-specific restriction enzyme subunit McrC